MRTKEEQIRDARKTIQNELKILFDGVGENALYNYAIYILELKKPDGSPLLAILDDDQTLLNDVDALAISEKVMTEWSEASIKERPRHVSQAFVEAGIKAKLSGDFRRVIL